MIHFAFILFFSLFTITTAFADNNWRGLPIEHEYRCSPYDKLKQYPYPQSVEDKIVADIGGLVYSPYSGQYFESDLETDIEHIVATSEGHDSGLCSAPMEVKALFATDILNLTIAEPKINRCGPNGKCGFDAAEWLPSKNRCWFAYRVLAVKRKYSLSVDLAEAKALEAILLKCGSKEMIFYSKGVGSLVGSHIPAPSNALDLYDVNNNGHITCSEAQLHDITPVREGHPAYHFMNDRNNDGVVCN